MARPWTEVIADPNFQALDPAAQDSARNAYFQQNVLPNIPKDANASAIRLKFDQDTVPTLKKQQAQTSAPAAPQTAAGHAGSVLDIAKQHPFTAGVGMLENALSGVTGGVGAVADAVTLSEPGTHDWAYQPRTQAGQQIAQAGAQEASAIGRGYDKLPGADTPLGQTIKRYGPEALAAVGTVTGAAEVPKAVGGIAGGVKAVRTPGVILPKEIGAQGVLDQAAANSGQSMGAAAAAPRVTGASPELQQAIVAKARSNGGAVNPEAVSRQLEADQLPVKVNLTEGQATQDPALFSEEQNLRAKHNGLAEHFNEQNANLVKNVQAIRDEIGPDVFSANHVEHGDTLIKSYQDIDAAKNADIKAKYQQLRDAAGGKFPVDARTLLDNSRAALAKELLTHDAPPGIMRTLGDLADSGQMTFEQFENLRTNLARIQRNFASDGNTRFAAGLIRDQMEQLPLEPGAASLKPLADAARGAARARFQALEADPAYKSAVNGTVDPDKFVRKFVINGSRDDVAMMRQNLADDPTAVQTMGVAVLDHLRDAAGIGPEYKGAFKQSGFNKAMSSLDPKLQSLVDPKTAEQLQSLGNVARNIQQHPVGATVNTSNTLSAGMADYAGGALEHAVNIKAGGLPVGTVGRKIIQHVKYGARVKQAIEPGAGIGRLVNTSPKVEAMLEAARRKAAAAQQVTQ